MKKFRRRRININKIKKMIKNWIGRCRRKKSTVEDCIGGKKKKRVVSDYITY